MKKKLLMAVLSGLLVIGPVLTGTAAELPDTPDSEASVGTTTEFDGDKAKYQPLIDAMFEALEQDAFGKPVKEWTLPDLTDFVNKKFPKMTKKERESDVIWKDGRTPGKEKLVSYHGSMDEGIMGSIWRMDATYNEGHWSSQNSADYFELDRSVQASDVTDDSGFISSGVDYHDDKGPAKLTTLNKALTMIEDPDLVAYMKKEKELDNSRKYNFTDGTSLSFTPNGNWGIPISDDFGDKSHLDDVRTYIVYTFNNHMIALHYLEGSFGIIMYNTHFTPTDMYRLYNQNSGEHFFTASREEADRLVTLGWKDEGVAWKAPVISDTPVYRLYDPNRGDHHYTPSEEEKNNLIAAGWTNEGVGWYSFERETTPLYRLYDPNAKTGSHHYTTSEEERDFLIENGWIDESIGWYGM